MSTAQSQTLVLRFLTPADEGAFLDGVKEWDGEKLSWYTFWWKPEMTYPEMLDRLEKDARGEDLKPGWMRHSMLYAFVEGRIVGRMSVRHELNDYLRRRGGHLGYAVAPRYRRRGYAREMLAQGLAYCRGIGLGRVMLTCEETNGPSWRLIERFGGGSLEKIEDAGVMIRKYWIELV